MKCINGDNISAVFNGWKVSKNMAIYANGKTKIYLFTRHLCKNAVKNNVINRFSLSVNFYELNEIHMWCEHRLRVKQFFRSFAGRFLDASRRQFFWV